MNVPSSIARETHSQKRPVVFGLVCSLLLLIAGCQTGNGPTYSEVTPAPPMPGNPNYSANKLHEGDVLSISFQYSTNFNAIQKITLDGKLNLESVGLLQAAGLTPLELQQDIARVYKPITKGDIVTVKLVSAVDGVYVSGAVYHPGRIPLERPLTAIEAIMEAGGFEPNLAQLSQVIVLRIEHGKQHSYHLNLKKALAGKEDVPFYLRPFDIVHVPTRTFNF